MALHLASVCKKRLEATQKWPNVVAYKSWWKFDE